GGCDHGDSGDPRGSSLASARNGWRRAIPYGDMTPEIWSRIEELFLRALELPQDGREKYLDEVCRGDESLRKELHSLLGFDDPIAPLVDSPFLSTKAVDDAAPETDSDTPGLRIGPYRLVRLLGRGGIGAVHLAVRDDDLCQKEVAIKLVNRGMDTDSMLNRFRQERQILANLEHPFYCAAARRRSDRRRTPLLRDGVRGWPADHEVLRRAESFNQGA